MTSLYFPGSDTKTQDFSRKYPGSKMETNVLLWHSTEGVNWPGYNGGATAPNATVFLSLKEKRMYVRSHTPADRSGRALENRRGGVETNTLNIFQVEIIGTCDPRYRHKWGTMKAGVDYFYVPDLPQWAIDELAKIPAWLHQVSPAFPIKDGALRGWLPYPDSYGNKNGQRHGFAEWNNTRGMVGHQHAAENSHGDPGDFNINAVVASALGTTVPDVPPVIIPPVIIDPMDPKNYFVGAKGDYITDYGKRVVIWSEHLGLPAPYTIGPGPSYTPTDQKATQKIQVALGYGSSATDLAKGGNSDGLPGPSTLATVFSDPPAKPKAKATETVVQFNGAGYNAARGKATAVKRVKPMVAQILSKRPDVAILCEWSAPMLRPSDKAMTGFTRALLPGKTPMTANGAGREIYVDTAKYKIVHVQKRNVTRMLDGDDKPMLGCVYEPRAGGARRVAVAFHSENQDGKDADAIRVQQCRDALVFAIDLCDTHGAPYVNATVAGDGNSYSWAKEEAERMNWREAFDVAESTKYAKYKTHTNWGAQTRGGHFDLVLVRHQVAVVSAEQTLNNDLSDHNMLTVVREIK